MSDWIWQGFYGPASQVMAAKLIIEQLSLEIVGVIIPFIGEGIVYVDADNSEGMFAIQTRTGNPIQTPEGLRVARPDIVARLVGA